jgi:hypothetical protein
MAATGRHVHYCHRGCCRRSGRQAATITMDTMAVMAPDATMTAMAPPDATMVMAAAIVTGGHVLYDRYSHHCYCGIL